MNVAIRTDASSQIGTGHFMRCLTLANALKQRGVQICFVSRGLPSHLRDMLTSKNISLVSLDSGTTSSTIDDLAHSHWLGISQAQDAQETIQALSDQSWDWLVVDHYALDARWESALRGTAKKILVIDDIADRLHDCDVLLDQNFYTDMQTRYIGKVPSHCQLLLGPHYALLRDEFRKLREQVKPRTGAVKRILVFFGGVDADNYTGRVVDILSEMRIPDLQVDVVIGAQHPCRIEIETQCAEQGYSCHVQTNRMAELMAVADLAIGAGGAATWERIFLGLPSLVRVTAFNQYEALSFLATSGYIDIWRDSRELISLLNARIKSNSSLPPLDIIRIGTDEVIDRILSRGWLVPFGVEHVRHTFKWLLSPQLREAFLLTSTPTIKQHCKYWRSVLNSSTQIVFAIISEGEHVGNCGLKYVDRENKCAEVWIYLGDASVRGQGVGESMMRLLEDEAKRVISDGRLFLHVSKFNTAAINLYQKLGFIFSDSVIGIHWNARASEVLCMEKKL